MPTASENCLMATAMLPILAAASTLCATLGGRSVLASVFARIGFASGFACGAVLAVLLGRDSGPTSPVIQLPEWTWFAFSSPHSLSISFGIEATCVKASLISLIGGIALLTVGGLASKRQNQFTEEIIFTTSLLYAAGVVFVFAPNFAQALFGWCAVTMLSVILIRLARHRVASIQSQRFNGFPPQQEGLSRMPGQSLQLVGNAAAIAGLMLVDRIWLPLTRQLPNWIGEQLEVVENASPAVQFIAALLGVAAILLTWLM